MARLTVPFSMHRNGWWLVVLCGVLGVRIAGWQLGLPLGVLLLASLLLHEAGHMLAAALAEGAGARIWTELRRQPTSEGPTRLAAAMRF
jgi:divalent metal cation (Fe/Co/Zn/Cd) transporter